MKFSEAWLRELIDPAVDTATLTQQLTMAGLEVGSVEAAGEMLDGVVVGEVRSVEPHPDADKLKICAVDDGGDEVLRVVCGAPNVETGARYPFARTGSKLPGGLAVRKAKIRGVESNGMLCSQKELGLSDDHSGLWTLPPDTTVGEAIARQLRLPDQVIELDLTPNRGDCLGMIGVAREVATLNGLDYEWQSPVAISAASDAKFNVSLEAGEACPVYAGRVVKGISTSATTPIWMCERLRRAGVRPLHPVVDVTNYVMLEMGQPMHGFDLATLSGGIVVRWARDGETLTLLDGREIALDGKTLVIADADRVLALAGVMGGERTGVVDTTEDVFLESAFFSPEVIAGKARSFGLHTDASHRFERGVDPTIQAAAIERATQLLVEIAGGAPGPVVEARLPDWRWETPEVVLRSERISRVLGVRVAADRVEAILGGLAMTFARIEGGWTVRPPSFRFDIAIEEDLIEEVARIHGYDSIPEVPALAPVGLPAIPEERVPVATARQILVDRGYHEVITYSFVDAVSQAEFAPGIVPATLANPLSEDLGQMRTSLWPGLAKVARENLSRQQDRVRIFESGVKFVPEADDLEEISVISGLATGALLPEQWGSRSRSVDFFDIKSDIDAIVRQTGRYVALNYQKLAHPALHPGRSAQIRLGDDSAGWLGQMHPQLAQKYGFESEVYLFELDLESILAANVPASVPISRYPAVRRDVALVVEEAVAVADIVASARDEAGDLAQSVFVFDIYRGDAIDSGLKSVALGLILQESSRTLTDEDADRTVSAVVARLERNYNAKIRV